jgi:MFS family permease
VSTDCPKGSINAHWFAFFNALTFQIIIGTPLFLYAKSIGASSTVLGLLAAATPLMTMLQLPAAKYLPVFGYRRFVLMGWGARTVFIFFVALIPLLGFLDNATKLTLLVFCILVFNMMRGAASAAWMPWIALLIPEEARARFLSRDQIFMYGGSLLALLVSALMIGGEVSVYEFSLVFLLSGLAGGVALYFIKKIPDVHAPDAMQKSAQAVPWKTIFYYPPFLALLIFNMLFVFEVGSLGVFTVQYLRDLPGFNDSVVLYLSCLSFVGSLLILPFVGKLLDRFGNKVVLFVSLLLFGTVILGWFCLAAGLVSPKSGVVFMVNLLGGVAGAGFNVANSRMAFAVMPHMGRDHFFALFSVITSLGLGASPVLWGISLDYIGAFEVITGAFHWHRHSIYFAVLFGLNILTLLQVHRLHERGAENGDAQLADAFKEAV